MENEVKELTDNQEKILEKASKKWRESPFPVNMGNRAFLVHYKGLRKGTICEVMPNGKLKVVRDEELYEKIYNVFKYSMVFIRECKINCVNSK